MKTNFTCPCGTFAFRRMPFRLCDAPGTFQRCIIAIFLDMVEKSIELFMDDFSVVGASFDDFLSSLELVLKRCKETKDGNIGFDRYIGTWILRIY